MAEKAMTRKEALTIAIEMLSTDEHTEETAEVVEILGKMLAAVSKPRKVTKSVNPEVEARKAKVMEYFTGLNEGEEVTGAVVYNALVEADEEEVERLGFTIRNTSAAMGSLEKDGKLFGRKDEVLGKKVYHI